MEFAKLIAEKKDPETEVKLHLVAANNEDYIENTKEAFEQMSFSLEYLGSNVTIPSKHEGEERLFLF